ncbi:MAG: carboxypeptidase regulatory-like domain-containing protein, partial [Candidatus Thermoplasmatota archaeon]|nr:carboxypeptidase regulatory-like domain-containing protein [Candidatus Thermoplasmatota archaeon]
VVSITSDGFQMENRIIQVNAGNNWHNVSKPQPGNVEGTVYFDENENGGIDDGEEMADASIEVIYASTGTNKVVETISTDENGRYETSEFLPGNYELNVTKLPGYETVTTVNIEENKTVSQNISMEYAKIKVTGETIRDDTNQPFDNVTINFVVDTEVENNTANESEVQSDSTGAYSVELLPGSYVVSAIEQINETGSIITYTFSDKLTLSIGQEDTVYNIALKREE